MRSRIAIVLCLFTFASSALCAAQRQGILHSFLVNGKDGYNPVGNLTFDSSGNLYGSTLYGGTYGGGTVFELIPQPRGGWSEKILHNFNGGAKDGTSPLGCLIFDASGNLYGSTGAGGLYGDGSIFELVAQPGGGWIERSLHNFSGRSGDGAYPNGELIFDSAGNLYGTTLQGGAGASCAPGCGTVFELSPTARGSWTETILHTFKDSNLHDGMYPDSGLTFDSAGNLYGGTDYGGDNNIGAIFQLKPTSSGNWTESVIFSFASSSNPAYPGKLTLDLSGNLYGTTYQSGADQQGSVFELSLFGGLWTETILHSFSVDGTDGGFPDSGLAFDSRDNLYGATAYGGSGTEGTVFELSPSLGGIWNETILANFQPALSNGYGPSSSVIFDAQGNLYITTFSGGSVNYGTVTEIRY